MEEVKKEVKKNKKKNKVASLLLALALILTCGVAGTIAQYQKSFTGNDTATVANFNVSATTDGTTKAKFNVFDTVLDEKGGAETAVAETTKGSGKLKIAPGTSGQYKVILKNDSDVSVDYALTVKLAKGGILNEYKSATYGTDGSTITNKKIPLQFALSTATDITTVPSGDWKDLDNLASLTNVSGSLTYQSGTTSPKTVYVYWRWAYDTSTVSTSDTRLDTAIGEIMQYVDGAGVATAPSSVKTDDNSLLTENSTFTQPEMEVGVTFTQKN